MSPGRRHLLLLAATVLGVALTARLGFWQLDRATRKEALQASIDARGQLPPLQALELATGAAELPAQLDRTVRLRGRWVSEATRYLDNRQMNGRPGFYVVTPLLLETGAAGDAVLVQRGWLPLHPAERDRVPPHTTAEGPVELVGRIAPWPGRLYDFGGAASGAIRQNLDPAAYAAEIRLRLRPFSVVQIEPAGAGADGLLRTWAQPAAHLHRHYGYAGQWFALSALIAGLYVGFQIVLPRWRRRSG